MRYLFSIIIIAICYVGASAQFAWIDPPVPDVTQEVTIYVDVAQDPNCNNLGSTEGPLYIWTWMPGDPAIPDGNGTWGSSNEALAMTNEGGTLWSFTMIPTEFYGVDADEVYESGISLLAKEKDGGGGGDCSEGGGEFKTSDIELDVPSPFATVRKVFSIPDLYEDSLYVEASDVFTLKYNNSIEEKPTMQNLSEVYVYPRGFDTDGNQYIVTPLGQVGNNPNLRMRDLGNGEFSFTIIPELFFGNLPPDATLEYMQFQIISWPLCGSDCAVDGEFIYPFACAE